MRQRANQKYPSWETWLNYHPEKMQLPQNWQSCWSHLCRFSCRWVFLNTERKSPPYLKNILRIKLLCFLSVQGKGPGCNWIQKCSVSIRLVTGPCEWPYFRWPTAKRVSSLSVPGWLLAKSIARLLGQISSWVWKKWCPRVPTPCHPSSPFQGA